MIISDKKGLSPAWLQSFNQKFYENPISALGPSPVKNTFIRIHFQDGQVLDATATVEKAYAADRLAEQYE